MESEIEYRRRYYEVKSELCYSQMPASFCKTIGCPATCCKPVNLLSQYQTSRKQVHGISDVHGARLNLALQQEGTMDKDRVEGKIKDIAGRVERQAGEWTGDEKTQAKGAAKQAEGKVQNAWGKVKDAVKPSNKSEDDEAERRDRAVNE